LFIIQIIQSLSLRLIDLATIINLLTHYAKGTPSFYILKLRLLIELLIQDYFISLYNELFQLFLYSTFHYR